MILYYIHGSPFARMGRVLLREYGIPHTEKEIVEFPPAPEYFGVNPLGQVPVLDDGSNRYFPTRIVLARIMTEAQTRVLNWREDDALFLLVATKGSGEDEVEFQRRLAEAEYSRTA